MWLNILMSVVSSELTKKLIAIGIKKLLEHKSDGITKDIAEVILDGVAQSRANNAPTDLIEVVKSSL